MSNILNTLNTTNTNVIPARKLRNDKNDYASMPLYRYSINEALKKREQDRVELEQTVHKQRKNKKDKDFLFPIILSTVTAFAIFIHKKINK